MSFLFLNIVAAVCALWDRYYLFPSERSHIILSLRISFLHRLWTFSLTVGGYVTRVPEVSSLFISFVCVLTVYDISNNLISFSFCELPYDALCFLNRSNCFYIDHVLKTTRPSNTRSFLQLRSRSLRETDAFTAPPSSWGRLFEIRARTKNLRKGRYTLHHSLMRILDT